MPSFYFLHIIISGMLSFTELKYSKKIHYSKVFMLVWVECYLDKKVTFCTSHLHCSSYWQAFRPSSSCNLHTGMC